MKNRGHRQRIHCLSPAWEKALKKADMAHGRQKDRLMIYEGLEEMEEEEREEEALAA